VGWVEAILLSGMVTSRNGWIESPFVQTPAGAADLAAGAVRRHIAGFPPLFFLPGIAQSLPLPDVMRGEELSILGIDDADGLHVLPGPHAKWIRMVEGRISAITTYMSGEISHLLERDSLVSRLIPKVRTERPEAFRRGVLAALADDLPGRILARIFSARSLVLFEQLAADDICDYLEGLLIGAEAREATEALQSRKVTIVGAGRLAERYRLALELRQLEPSVCPPRPQDGFAKMTLRAGFPQNI
jgi:2-dehydro-3-deoxygalactonokinase